MLRASSVYGGANGDKGPQRIKESDDYEMQSYNNYSLYLASDDFVQFWQAHELEVPWSIRAGSQTGPFHARLSDSAGNFGRRKKVVGGISGSPGGKHDVSQRR
jgi:hypothetical protein